MKKNKVISESIPSKEVVDEERKRLRYHKEFFRTMRTTFYVLVVVASIAVLIATLVLPMVRVAGNSMTPTLDDGDIILSVKTDDFTTGDLCGFYYQNRLLLKRIIGVPGDIIEIKEDGTVIVNGKVIEEPYISEKALGECDLEFPYQVPENRFFVLGDHRETSIDSRSSAIGCIEDSQIIGKVFMRVWPLSKISFIH